jgi:hypothetical protein
MNRYVIVRACREKTKAAINVLAKERRDQVLSAEVSVQMDPCVWVHYCS